MSTEPMERINFSRWFLAFGFACLVAGTGRILWPQAHLPRPMLLERANENALPRPAEPKPAGGGREAAASRRPAAYGRDYRAYVQQLRAQGWTEPRIHKLVTGELQEYFRREQYRMELQLEQFRFPLHYWEVERDRPPFQVEKFRLEELRAMDAELNGFLQNLFGAEVDPVSPRNPIFGPATPAIKLDFLTEDSRRRMEDALMSADPNNEMSGPERLALARRMLSAEDYALFSKWNSPLASALHAQLVGFDATQEEFDSIYRWQEITSGKQGPADPAGIAAANEQLKIALGKDRLAAFEKTADPDYRTVVEYLERNKLEINKAGWLFSIRQQALSAISTVEQDTHISDEKKSETVEQLRNRYNQIIAEGLRERLVDISSDSLF